MNTNELAEHLNNSPWTFRDRDSLILCLGQLGMKTAVEVGVREGNFSKFILENTNVEKLYSVDPWEFNPELNYPEKAYDECKQQLSGYGSRSILIKGYSPNVCVDFEKESLDFVYLDGLHSYEAVSADIAGWWPLLKSGGIMAGHDFNPIEWSGVVRAVSEFAQAHNLTIHLTGITFYTDEKQPSWILFKE